jgi:hypothetical protein
VAVFRAGGPVSILNQDGVNPVLTEAALARPGFSLLSRDPFQSGATEFLGTAADVAVDIRSRTDLALTAADFRGGSRVCGCEPLNYSALLLGWVRLEIRVWPCSCTPQLSTNSKLLNAFVLCGKLNFEDVLRRRLFERLEHFQRTRPDLLSTFASRVCLAVVITSQTLCRVPIRKHSRYMEPRRPGDLPTCGNRIATIIGVKYGTFC